MTRAEEFEELRPLLFSMVRYDWDGGEANLPREGGFIAARRPDGDQGFPCPSPSSLPSTMSLVHQEFDGTGISSFTPTPPPPPATSWPGPS